MGTKRDRRYREGQGLEGQTRKFRGRTRYGESGGTESPGIKTKKGRETEEESDRVADSPWEHKPMGEGAGGRARWEARLPVQLLNSASPEQAGG